MTVMILFVEKHKKNSGKRSEHHSGSFQRVSKMSDRPLKRARCESPKTPVQSLLGREPVTCPAKRHKSRSNSMASTAAADSPAKLVFFEEDDEIDCSDASSPLPPSGAQKGYKTDSCSTEEVDSQPHHDGNRSGDANSKRLVAEAAATVWAKAAGAFFNALDRESLNVVD